MPKQLTGYALLRSVCTEEEKKELTYVKKYATSFCLETSVRRARRPSAVLFNLFNWNDPRNRKGVDYWRSVYKRLAYLEASKGW